MKMINGILHLSISELEAFGFTKEFLYKVTKEYRDGARRSYSNLLDPEDNRISMVQYNTIPQATHESKKLPLESELVASQLIPSLISVSHEVLEYFMRPSNPKSVRAQAPQYQRAVAYLDWVAPATLSFAKQYGFPGVDPLYSAVIRLMLAEKLQVWQITNLDRFKRKISPFKKWAKTQDPADRTDALKSLISKSFGKQNAAKVVAKDRQAEEIQSALVVVYSDPKKFTINETYLTYSKLAIEQYQLYTTTDKKEGWDERCFITEQTIANFLYKEDIKQLWYAKRHGEKVAKDVYERNTKRIPASYANAKWIMDGTPLHRYFQSEDSVWNRVHVYFIIDGYSWCILGVGVSLIGETTGQVLQAMRAAAQHVGWIQGDNELYAPFEFQTDNSSANQSAQVKEAISLIGAVHRPAAVGNSKAKKVEPFNMHFFARWMKFRDGFTGSMGMSNKLDKKINQEALTKAVTKKQLPDLTRTLEELQQDVQHWNNDRTWNNDGVPEADRKTPYEKYHESLQATAERQRKISEHLAIEAFYYQPTKAKQVADESKSARAKKTIHIPQEYKFTNNGIQVERKSPFDGKAIKINLDVADPDFNSRYIGSRFTLKIEPLNYDHAYLFLDGQPVLDRAGKWVKAVNRDLFHEALADHTEGEAKRLAEHEAIKPAQKALTVSRFELHALTAKKLGIESGKIANPHLFGQKEYTDGLKIAASEQLLPGNRILIEAEQEVFEAEPVTATKKLNRYGL